MLRISWKDRVINDEVYRCMGTVKALLEDIDRRQLSFNIDCFIIICKGVCKPYDIS